MDCFYIVYNGFGMIPSSKYYLCCISVLYRAPCSGFSSTVEALPRAWGCTGISPRKRYQSPSPPSSPPHNILTSNILPIFPSPPSSNFPLFPICPFPHPFPLEPQEGLSPPTPDHLLYLCHLFQNPSRKVFPLVFSGFE